MSLISKNNECNEEDKEYKRSMYERQREIEKLNEEKSKKKNKFSVI
jgi:DNA modification methylase